jgi:hypothetical protein
MLSESQRAELKSQLRVMQIIVGALALGVINFLVVVLVIATKNEAGPVDVPLLTYLSAGVAAAAAFASIVVPMILAGSVRRSFSNDTDGTNIRALAQIYQTQLIIRCAILEGAAFFCIVAYMHERHVIGLIAAGLLLLMLLAQFPTASRLEAWVENERVVADQMRLLR